MTTTTLHEESTDQGGFYVPRYEVKIEGANLPRDVLFDVRSVTYQRRRRRPRQLRPGVNNWDERAALQVHRLGDQGPAREGPPATTRG